jgi:hypothetical protein
MIRLAFALALAGVAATNGALAAEPPPTPDAAAPSATDDSFVDYMLIEDWALPLRLSGNTVVSRRYLPFYAVALYVGRGPVDAAALTRGHVACRIAIRWLVPTVSVADADAYWREQFGKAVPDPLARQRLEPSFARIAAAFGAAARGDELLLDYHPDRGLRVWRNGAVAGQFAGLELNRTVLSLWLGPQAPSDLRNALLGIATPFDATQ